MQLLILNWPITAIETIKRTQRFNLNILESKYLALEPFARMLMTIGMLIMLYDQKMCWTDTLYMNFYVA